MDLPPYVTAPCDRLGLHITPGDTDALSVERGGWAVQLNRDCIDAAQQSSRGPFAIAWLLFGLRIGLDKRIEGSTDSEPSPSHQRFRRTGLRRYHEAPSVHGDHLPILVPQLTREIFESIADTPAHTRPWLNTSLEILTVRETGLQLDILTAQEQQESALSDDERWQRVRSALFYQSYKVRPQREIEGPGGILRIFETSEGFGASRALLLPEYDYNAAREYGYLAVPSRDQIVIARPDDRSHAADLLPALREKLHDCLKRSHFGLTDAIFQLGPDSTRICEEPTFVAGESPGFDGPLVLGVDSP